MSKAFFMPFRFVGLLIWNGLGAGNGLINVNRPYGNTVFLRIDSVDCILFLYLRPELITCYGTAVRNCRIT